MSDFDPAGLLSLDERRAIMEAVTRKLIGAIQAGVGADLRLLKSAGIGVAVFAFEFGEPKPGEDLGVAYISTAERADVIETIKQWVARMEVGLVTDPAGEVARG